MKACLRCHFSWYSSGLCQRAYNRVVRCPFTRALLAIAFVGGCQPLSYGQPPVPSAIQETESTKICPSQSADDNQPSESEIAIANIVFDGDLRMPSVDQQQIVASLKQRTYSGALDDVTSEVLERVRVAWQDRGYFKVQALGNASVPTTAPVAERIAVTVNVDEGQQYRLGKITFKNNKTVRNVTTLRSHLLIQDGDISGREKTATGLENKTLRSLFPIQDGDIFSREKIAKGLENLRKMYGEMGFVNFTSVPDTSFDEERKMVTLKIELDEGKQFYIGSVNILGLDQHVADDLLNDLLLKPGDVYNQRIFELSLQYLSLRRTNVSFSHYSRQLDERAGTIAITFDFRPCPTE